MKTSFAVVVMLALAAPAMAQSAPQVAMQTLSAGATGMAIPSPQSATQVASPTGTPAVQQFPSQPIVERQEGDHLDRSPQAARARSIPTSNVRVEVTITEQTGSAAPSKKVVSMVVADGRSGGVRSVSAVPLASGGLRDLPLNVDATAYVTEAQRVLVDLRFSYTSATPMLVPVVTADRTIGDDRHSPTEARTAFATVTENLSVLLTPGTPSTVARSADAATDRTVTVEVKADILK